MPAGPEETDNHKSGSITEQVAKNPSSKTDSQASDHHHHKTEEDNKQGDQVQFRHHEANPGPAVSKDFSAQEEGTKEERRAKAEEMNK